MNKEEATKVLKENVSYSCEMLSEAIEAGADVNAKNDLGEPIFKVVMAENSTDSEIVNLLFNANIDINIENNDGETALYEALSNKDWEKAGFLIKKGANIDMKNKFGETLLTTFLKICIGDFSPVRYLIEKGADVNILNGKGEPPIILAGKKNELPIIKLLIDNGAITNDNPHGFFIRGLDNENRQNIKELYSDVYEFYIQLEEGIIYNIVTDTSLIKQKE